MLGSETFPLEHLPPDFRALFKPMMMVFDNLMLIMVLQVVVAIVAIAAGVNFLKLRKWARTAFETLTWLAIAYVVVVGVYCTFMFLPMADNITLEQLSPDMEKFKYLGLVISVAVNLICCVHFVIMLVKFRGADIRNIVE